MGGAFWSCVRVRFGFFGSVLARVCLEQDRLVGRVIVVLACTRQVLGCGPPPWPWPWTAGQTTRFDQAS